ncbi:MAG TPA: hypothetical protein VGR35_11850 [Tepidisphaeraceae bacterium]|nr:hypothetical protein [Tepidisphaeraceae bacterium]
MPLALSSPATVAPVTHEPDVAADANWRANVAALTGTQPALVPLLSQAPVDATWLYARDGTLTARSPGGAWWGGCSVPAAAAKAMLKSFVGAGTVACFLRPPSAAAVRVALDKLRPHQGLVVLVPDAAAMRVMLHCENFAADLRAHRLWLVTGADWEARLATLLRENDGLPTPTQFVRLNDGDEELAEAMIAPAQRVFSDITQHRATAIRQFHDARWTGTTAGACVIAPTHFRLWDDAGHTLARLAGELGWHHVDPDNPACASPLAMARAASACAAVIMPNTSRADLPNVVSIALPWITWVTSARVPAFAGAGPGDALIVADPAWRDAAIAGGWPGPRVHVATWPAAGTPAAKATGPLLICADLHPPNPPKEVVEMSSQRLLWEAISQELTGDPFVLGACIVDYLHTRMKRLNIAALDQRRFVDELIVPAYARGLADLLRRNGLPLRLVGAGWDAAQMFKPFATGPVTTREAFDEAIASAAALVHVSPITGGHPIHHAGRPVVCPSSGRDRFLRDARAALAGKLPLVRPLMPALTPALLARLVSEC